MSQNEVKDRGVVSQSVQLTRNQIADAKETIQSMPGEGTPSGPNNAMLNGYELLHPDIRLELAGMTGGLSRSIVHLMSFNKYTASILLRHYIHVGATGRLCLPTVWDAQQLLDVHVIACRHVTGMVHQATLRFTETLDLRHYIQDYLNDCKTTTGDIEPEMLFGEILIFSHDEASSRLISHFLDQTQSKVEVIDSFADVLNSVKMKSFDLILCDVDDRNKADCPLDLLEQVKCRNRVVALTSKDPPESEITDRPLVVDVLHKPFNRPTVLATVYEALQISTGAAVTSKFADDENMTSLIEWYRQHIQQVLRELRKAISDIDIDEVRRRCRSIQETASGYGYEQLADTAAKALVSLDASMSVEESKDDLTRLESTITAMR